MLPLKFIFITGFNNSLILYSFSFESDLTVRGQAEELLFIPRKQKVGSLQTVPTIKLYATKVDTFHLLLKYFTLMTDFT